MKDMQQQQTLPAVEGTPAIGAELVALRDALLDGLDEDARDGALAEAEDLVAKAAKAEVMDQDSYDQVGRLRTSVSLSHKTLQEISHPVKSAANKLHKRICDLVNADTLKLGRSLRDLDHLLTDWDRGQRQEAERVRQEALTKQRQELKQHTEAAAKGEPVPPAPVPASIPYVMPEPNAAVAMRYTYTCQVIDQAALPREWWTIPEPDQKRLDEHYQRTRGKADIPGCEAVEHSHPRRR